MSNSDLITIRKPDDWHLHLRDGAALRAVVADTARRFRRAIIMPNLKPPVTTVKAALAYRERILEALRASGESAEFEPLMTLYLTDNTSAAEIRAAAEEPGVAAVKLYPAGATTNSDHGVTSIPATYATLEEMEKADLPLCVHAEVTNPDADVFDREALFIDRHLADISERFPGLRIIFEHITTRAAVEFVRAARDGVAATITAHHLLLNRNAIFQGGIRPHYYCLPVLKREGDRQALMEAALSGEARFFAGTDSAPHARGAKENDCGCAGMYTAAGAVELYAEAFDGAGGLDRLENFLSGFGADFYRLPRNEEQLTLRRAKVAIPRTLPFGDEELIPFRAGGELEWALA